MKSNWFILNLQEYDKTLSNITGSFYDQTIILSNLSCGSNI